MPAAGDVVVDRVRHASCSEGPCLPRDDVPADRRRDPTLGIQPEGVETEMEIRAVLEDVVGAPAGGPAVAVSGVASAPASGARTSQCACGSSSSGSLGTASTSRTRGFRRPLSGRRQVSCASRPRPGSSPGSRRSALLERAEERPLAELDEVEVVGPHGRSGSLMRSSAPGFPNTGCWAKGLPPADRDEIAMQQPGARQGVT